MSGRDGTICQSKQAGMLAPKYALTDKPHFTTGVQALSNLPFGRICDFSVKQRRASRRDKQQQREAIQEYT